MTEELTADLVDNYIDGVVPYKPTVDEVDRVLKSRGFRETARFDAGVKMGWICQNDGVAWVLRHTPGNVDWYELYRFPSESKSDGMAYGTLRMAYGTLHDVMCEFDRKAITRI